MVIKALSRDNRDFFFSSYSYFYSNRPKFLFLRHPKCLENGNNRKKIKWLLMVAPRIFRVWRASTLMEILNDFFFKRFSIKFWIWWSKLLFFTLLVWHCNGPKLKKGGLKTEKATLKLEKREFRISYDRSSFTKS